MRMERFTRRLFAGAACLLTTGCEFDILGGAGGGGNTANPTETPQDAQSSPPPPGYADMDDGTAAGHAAGAEFSRIEPTHEERQHLGWAAVCGSDSYCVSANNYALQNIHYAHTASLPDGTKLRGKDVLVAVVDEGFRVTHQELAGKNIDRYLGATSALDVADHGTAVASIAAGLADGKGIMGVAPEADLHLTSWKQVNEIGVTPFLHQVAGGTNDAGARGAAVQNNSWGWTRETSAAQEKANFSASGIKNYAGYISSHRGGQPGDWQNLFDAYNRFQETGVIVYANSNDNKLGDASSWAALPLFVPELSEAWLTVSNALVTLNSSDGSIRNAELLSAPCGTAARFCVTSDGVVHAPTAQSDTSYGTMTGTSFAAPQVSGQVALLAQAFPDLSPAELTVRLLATAQKDWASFKNSVAGEQTFASGVVRSYSNLYGHGIPDMKAALAPVEGLFVPSGENVSTAQRTSVDHGIATGGPVVGNAVAKAMANREIMVVDALGTDFYLPGSALGKNSKSRAPTANARHLARNVDRVAAAFAFMDTDQQTSVSLHDAAVPKLFFSQALSNVDGETAFSHVFPMGDGNYMQFAGYIEETGEENNAAFSMSRLMSRGGVATEISFSFGHSAGAFFGTEARGPFVAAKDTGNLAAGISVSKMLSESWSIGAYAEFGSGFVSEGTASLVDYGSFAYASGGLSARRRDVLTGRDMIDFYAGVRPSAVAGRAQVSLPVGRDTDGTIHYEDLAVNLAEADVPMRMGLVYQNRTERDFNLLVGFNTDFLASNEPEPAYSVSLGLKKAF